MRACSPAKLQPHYNNTSRVNSSSAGSLGRGHFMIIKAEILWIAQLKLPVRGEVTKWSTFVFSLTFEIMHYPAVI